MAGKRLTDVRYAAFPCWSRLPRKAMTHMSPSRIMRVRSLLLYGPGEGNTETDQHHDWTACSGCLATGICRAMGCSAYLAATDSALATEDCCTL